VAVPIQVEKPGPSTSEKALEAIAAIGLLGLLAVVAWYWVDLPARVPMHFNAAGQADRWGSKRELLFVPVIAVVIYLLLSVLGRFPQLYNYPWPITEANAAEQYRLARRLILDLKALMPAVFCVITFAVCLGAKGTQILGVWFLVSSLGAVFGLIGSYFVAAYRAR
jgi:uncharacterized membrane protein